MPVEITDEELVASNSDVRRPELPRLAEAPQVDVVGPVHDDPPLVNVGDVLVTAFVDEDVDRLDERSGPTATDSVELPHLQVEAQKSALHEIADVEHVAVPRGSVGPHDAEHPLVFSEEKPVEPAAAGLDVLRRTVVRQELQTRRRRRRRIEDRVYLVGRDSGTTDGRPQRGQQQQPREPR